MNLTHTGRVALASAEEAGTRVLRQLFGSLTPHQLTDLDALLTRMGTTLTDDDAD
ncbi:hypothetical protein [Streptomyces humi]